MITSSIKLMAAACGNPNFFTFPTWYKYLPKQNITIKDVGTQCTPQINSLNDVWLVVAAVLDILLRLAALAAVIFVIYGGAMYITSQGNPDAAAKARGTIINALIGLLISLTAAAMVQFIAGRFN